MLRVGWVLPRRRRQIVSYLPSRLDGVGMPGAGYPERTLFAARQSSEPAFPVSPQPEGICFKLQGPGITGIIRPDEL